jgi:hypothetical protein
MSQVESDAVSLEPDFLGQLIGVHAFRVAAQGR